MVLTTVADAAAALDHAHQQLVASEIAIALSLAALCELHQVDETMLVPGAERCVSSGADGTPHIGEFVAGEVAALLGISVGSAFGRIADVFNVRHRHPTLWEAFLAGQLRWWEATRVSWAATLAGLDAAGCARLDRMCAAALRVQPWQRVRRNIDRWIIQADPAKAAERAAALAADRHLTVGRIEDGHTSVWGRLDAADGIMLDEALDHLADQVEGANQRDRRAAAMGVMARSVLGQAPLPVDSSRPSECCPDDQRVDPGSPAHLSGAVGAVVGVGDRVVADVTAGPGAGAADAPVWVMKPTRRRRADLVLRIDAADVTDPVTGVADIDRWGPVLATQLSGLLAGCAVTVRPVVVGDSLSAVDAYQVPEAMRLALETRNPVDVFPYAVTSAHSCDIDHTIAFDHQNKAGRGQTRLSNLGPLSRFTHRLKTLGGWRLAQPEPGVYQWRSPLGYEYLTTPEGTVMTARPRIRRRSTGQVEPTSDDPSERHQNAPRSYA